MPIEPKRGCGYRKVGGLYLVGTGIAYPCDSLPLELWPCESCGFDVPFTRNFMWIKSDYIGERHHAISLKLADQKGLDHHSVGEDHKVYSNCHCPSTCPICHPLDNGEKFGFMWVGKRYYTPEGFVKEAKEVGVCKRIGQIPKDLVLGKTWVLLAHLKVPFYNGENFGPLNCEPEYKKAIFYAFIPQRIEKLIWKSQATEETLAELEEQGITPIIVPNDDKAHAQRGAST